MAINLNDYLFRNAYPNQAPPLKFPIYYQVLFPLVYSHITYTRGKKIIRISKISVITELSVISNLRISL